MLGIKVTELKRDEVSKELADKYFVNSYGSSIDRFHLPELMAEEYDAYMSEYAPKSAKPANLKFETASDYYKEKIRKDIVAKDFGLDPKYVDFKDYVKDERFYEWYDTGVQIAHYNCPYMTPSVNDHSDTIRESYATGLVDVEALNMLWSFCVQAIRQHKAMLLIKVDSALQCVVRLIKDSEGLKFNTAKGSRIALNSYIKFFKELLKDKEFKAYIDTHSDVDVHAESEVGRRDFIETYLKLYETIGLDFTETELFEKYADPEDAEILNVEFTSYNENELGDDEDEGYEEEEEVVASETDAEEA